MYNIIVEAADQIDFRDTLLSAMAAELAQSSLDHRLRVYWCVLGTNTIQVQWITRDRDVISCTLRTPTSPEPQAKAHALVVEILEGEPVRILNGVIKRLV